MPTEPVLFLVFNRPDTTARVFAAIREARPERLYVAADGPRKDRAGETELCSETRRIATAVDWPCEVKTLFRDENLGCGKAVSGAISWFFENEPEGIILEDDCLPHPDFFPYCGELLRKYRDDTRVMFIGGTNYQDGVKRGDASYYFSNYSHVWGWATWRRAWQRNDFSFSGMSGAEFSGLLKERFAASPERAYWKWIYNKLRAGKIDTWDYQWQFSVWRAGGFSVIPNVNLVSNIGATGTHTGTGDDPNINVPVAPILPLSHPSRTYQDTDADVYFYEHRLKPGRKGLLGRILAKVRALNG